jgi:uncharacterized protein YndB with AHSA1/START domain
MPKKIDCQVVIPAPVSQVWEAWTTEEGAKTFFAPECRIDLRVGGAYEMFFDPSAPAGERGGEGLTILAIQPEKLLSFTWNAPPHLSEVRGQLTHVNLRFGSIDEGKTELKLSHDGWGEGGQWDEAFEYFTIAWGDVVLPRLKYSFEVGPVDWENPPTLGNRVD